MDDTNEIQLFLKVSYNDYQLAMKILNNYFNNLIKVRENTRKKRDTIGDDNRCLNRIPKFTIVDSNGVSSNN